MNIDLNITKTQIKVKGLKKEYKFMHISDLHMGLIDELNDTIQRYLTTLERADTLFAPDRVLPDAKLPIYMNLAKEEGAFPIMTGDIIDVPSKANTDFLSSLVNKDNTFYVLGNHDWSFLDYHYRRNVFDTKENDSRCKAYYDKYYPYFHTLVSDGDANCQKIEYEDLILIGIDNGDREFTEQHLNYVKEQNKKNKPILLCFHVPIYTEELAIPVIKIWRHANSLAGGPNNIDKAKTKEFIDFITSDESNVFAILCGDVHFNNESKVKGVLPQYVVGGAYDNQVRLITLSKKQ